tara:strand:- start:1826 stop:2164 length:339 start_codon:yes stop_codon:yes gene_type:complete
MFNIYDIRQYDEEGNITKNEIFFAIHFNNHIYSDQSSLINFIMPYKENTKQKETITDLRNQLYALQKLSLQPNNTTNNIYINNLNVNFNEIQNHLPNYTFNAFSFFYKTINI